MPPSHRTFLSFNRAVAANGSQPRLFCFAYAGGSASIYAAWARALAPTITVLGVEMPGHGSRFTEPPLDTVAAMALDAANAIEASGDDSPFAIYGHSLGAIVAFETARLLQSRGIRPSLLRHVFAGAARAPHLPRPMPPVSDMQDSDFLDTVQHRYGGLPAALFDEPELLAMVLPVLRADFKAYEQYQYLDPAPLKYPVTAFHGTADAVVTGEAVREWSGMTENSFSLLEMDGDHFFLNTHRDFLLERIRAVLGPHSVPVELAAGFSTIEKTY